MYKKNVVKLVINTGDECDERLLSFLLLGRCLVQARVVLDVSASERLR